MPGSYASRMPSPTRRSKSAAVIDSWRSAQGSSIGMPPAIDASSPSVGAREAPSTLAGSTSVSGVSSESTPSATNVSRVAAVKLFVQDATRNAVAAVGASPTCPSASAPAATTPSGPNTAHALAGALPSRTRAAAISSRAGAASGMRSVRYGTRRSFHPTRAHGPRRGFHPTRGEDWPVAEGDEQREQRAEQLKERVYITFTALAVVLALRADVAHETVAGAAFTLTVAVVGTLLAVFVADVVAHITVHEALPSRAELRHMTVVVLGAAETLVIPLLIIALAALDVLTLDVALTASVVVLVVTLVAVGYLAVRRLRLPLGQRLLVLLAESALGLAVVGLELLAH